MSAWSAFALGVMVGGSGMVAVVVGVFAFVRRMTGALR